MVTKMTKNELMQILEKNMNATRSDRGAMLSKSFKEKIERSPAGSALPRRDVFHDAENREEYNARIEMRKKEALEAVNAYLGGLSKSAAAVPSEEGLRAVQMFALLDPGTLTKEDYAQRVDALMNEYGQDATTYETLRGMAVKAGIKDFKPHKDIVARDAAESLVRDVSGFFDGIHELGYPNDTPVSAGRISFTLANIESNLGGLED